MISIASKNFMSTIIIELSRKSEKGFLKCVEAILKRDRNADAEWMVITRVLLQLVSGL